MSDISDKEQTRKKPRIKKTLEQQLASAQMRLNRLQHKSKKESKQIETRQKIILGAEVAKALDCDVFTVDKDLVLGMLLEIPHLHPDDKEKLIELIDSFDGSPVGKCFLFRDYKGEYRQNLIKLLSFENNDALRNIDIWDSQASMYLRILRRLGILRL